MGKLRRAMASYWTALGLGLLAAALHVAWYMVGKPPGAEVVSGFGAALVVLGVFIASNPYVRTGLGGPIQAALPKRGVAFMAGRDTARRHHERVAEERPKVTRDVYAERVVAVVVVVIGTLLNGYGPLIARLLHLQQS